MRRMITKTATVAATAAALLVGLAACSPAAAQPTAQSDTSDPGVVVGTDTIIIDVRTPEEYATGHLEGAQLIDFNGGQVPVVIPNLDPDAEYLVYCRSGNRSGQAIALMEQAGFTIVTNLGSLEQAASATGLSIVQ